MTNLEYVRNLPIEKIAELTLKEVVTEDFDYDWEENLEYRGLTSYYRCSDGEAYDDYDEALKHEIWWLQQGRIENDG